MTPLGWGRRLLMCPPEHFAVLYEINPWMHQEVAVDLDVAREQWGGLVSNLVSAGAEVELLEPREGLPDMVFTANAGTVNLSAQKGRVFVASRFRHPHRGGEVACYCDWFEADGWSVQTLPDDVVHEGAGDSLPFDGIFLSGYRTRSDAIAHNALSRLLEAPVRAIELVDSRFYHLDLTFCPLDDRRALVGPLGWDDYGVRVVKALVPEPVELERDEILGFCANSVVVGNVVVMPSCPVRLGRLLEGYGFEVVETPMGEFVKAGGACRCLTLALDVDIDPSRATEAEDDAIPAP